MFGFNKTQAMRMVGKALLKGKAYTPEMLLVTGIVAGISGAVILAKNHKKASPKLAKIAESVVDYVRIAEGEGLEIIRIAEEIKPEVDEFVSTTIKAYGPPMALGAVSLYLILSSYGVMRGRNKTLLAVAATLQSGFMEYRRRVQENLGVEEEQKLYLGFRDIPTVIISDEDGKRTKRKGTRTELNEEISPIIYLRRFDSTNRNWSQNHNQNHFFLKAVEAALNNYLQTWGYLTLNQAYKQLGFAECPEGAIVGWSRYVDGDGFVDLGIGDEPNVLESDYPPAPWIINPNVNGIILDFIGRS